VDWEAAASAVQNARTHLPRLAEEFFAIGRRAARKSVKPETLHRFRLAVKRFRYTLEVFRPLYGPALDERLSSLHRLQQHLGVLNDCATTRQILLDSTYRKSVSVKQVLARIEEKERAGKRKALKYWNSQFASPDEERKWVRYLRVFAGRSRRIRASAA